MGKSMGKLLGMTAVFVLLSVALSACGGNKEEQSSPTPPASSSATPSASPSETPSESPSASPPGAEEATGDAAVSGPAAPEAPTGYQEYVDEVYGTTFRYPEGWEVEGSDGGTIVATFFVPPEDENDVFEENVSVAIEDLGGEDVTLEILAEASKKQLGEAIANFQIVKEETAELDGLPYYSLHFSGTQGELDLIWQQVYMIVDGFTYIFTYTAEPESFDKFVGQASEIIGSWNAG
ncbi:DcrB-related protein [Paenibacillaceae bacterium WGS1546]|uniref:DcrB-related protein n=1 Tax=Cohnella sp. WGS1546 TaxID=3366810 RepID=UPI00372CFB0C